MTQASPPRRLDRAQARRRARRRNLYTHSLASLIGVALVAAALLVPAAPDRASAHRSVGDAPKAAPVLTPSVTVAPSAAAGVSVTGTQGEEATAAASSQPSASQASASSASTVATTATPAAGAPLSVVALGDSVPAGSACGCEPFPALFATDVQSLTGTATQSVNLGKPGITSGDLLRQLATGTADAARVAQAAVITVTIGANDFSYVPSGQCPQLRCYAPGLKSMTQNVVAVLQRISELRPGQPTAVRVTGYWEVWKDGQVGAREGADYMLVNDALTVAVNSALAHAASVSSARYVDLRAAFRAAPGAAGDTELLAADGDHPNAAGHRLIAELLQASGLAPLTSATVTPQASATASAPALAQ